MGGDGGSIPGRTDLVKEQKPQKTAIDVTFGRSKLFHWTHCTLTNSILQPPICVDSYGNLYNKYDLLNAIYHKKLPNEFNHISKMKRDIITIKNLKLRKDMDNNHKESIINDESDGGLFECPITGLRGNGYFPFIVFRKCGCMISEKALKQVAKHHEE